MAEIHDWVRALLESSDLQKALAKAFHTDINSSSEFEEIELADHLRRARGQRMVLILRRYKWTTI